MQDVSTGELECLSGSLLLLPPQPAGHGRDQGGALPAAILRPVERHLALRRQILQSLLHYPRETGGRNEKEGRLRATKVEEDSKYFSCTAVKILKRKPKKTPQTLTFKRNVGRDKLVSPR